MKSSVLELWSRRRAPNVRGTNATKRSIKGSPEEGIVVAFLSKPMSTKAANKTNHEACFLTLTSFDFNEAGRSVSMPTERVRKTGSQKTVC